MVEIIEIGEDAIIYYWFDSLYLEKIKSQSKRIVERKELENKLKEYHPTLVLDREQNGVPFVIDVNFKHISISHSNGYYAVCLSKQKEVGVDIQTFKDSLDKGRDYFVNEREEPIATDNLSLHLIWIAKEAVYKMKKGRVNDLKEDATIIGIDRIEKKVYVDIDKQRHQVSYIQEEEFILGWTLA